MVDFNKKILNSDKFRQAAIFFQEHGCYTLAPKGTTDYAKYWDEETNRCLYGYTAQDGDSISGYNYFYLNYSPIMKLQEVEYTDRFGDKRTRRERIFGFPRFWDYDYYYFNAVDEAESAGKHMVNLKCRQRGYSFKGASMLVRNYELIPGSKNFAVASEQKFLIGDGILTKAWQIMDFVDKHTAWSKQRLTSTRMERVSGFKITDEFGKQTEQGYLSSITGITLKNDPERLRGTRGKLVLFEEGGKFPNLETAWRVEQPAVETDDGVAFGLMIAFGTGGTEGCVMAGSNVYSSDGRLLNIENIHKSDGIVSYDEQLQRAVSEQIQYIGDPISKQCVHIETKQYRDLNCSIDHPVYASNRVDCNECRVWEWINAGDLKVGDLIAVSQSIPNFTNNSMFDPYLIGLLIGDGTYGGTPVLTNCDEDILSYVTNKYKCTYREKPAPTKDGRILRSISIFGIRDELRNIGIYGQTKLKKRLPDCIFSSRESDCCELLAGLIDTDGNVSIRKGAGNRMPYTVVLISTICLEMAKQIRDLFQKLGIHASIQKKKQRDRNREIRDVNPCYNIEVVDKDSLIQLCTKIKPKVKYKRDKLDQILNVCINKKRWRKQKFEYETISLVKDLGINDVYNIQVPNTHTYIVNGIITHNSSFDGLKNLFYHPEAFNCLSFPNIWDDGQGDTKCGFFVPAWSNMESTDENGQQRFMDKDGNSLKEKAVEELIAQRNKVKDGGASQTSIDRFVSERPLKPQEAVLELGKNIFPRQLLMNQLTRIRTNEKLRNMKHIVDLFWDGNGGVRAEEKKSGDITTYHLKKDDKPQGSIVIWEYPIKEPPFGLYIGGCLTPGEKVCTQRGLVNVEDVTLDDKLINKDGQFVDIRNLQRYDKENEDIYTIRTANSYRTTTFTREHPILCSPTLYGKYDFIKAKDIQTGYYCKFPNVYYNTNEECKDAPINSDLFWWFVGLWLGDGWCDSKKYSVSISFDVNQKFYFDKCYNFIQNELGITPYYRVRRNTIELNFTSKRVQQWLNSTFGNSCYNKSIPDRIKRINDRYKLNIIAGYLASDGCVYNRNSTSTVEFVSVNLNLLEDIQDLLFALKIISGISKLRDCGQSTIRGRVINQREAYHARVAQSGSILLKRLFDKYCIEDTVKAGKIIDRQLSNHSNKQIVFDDEFKHIICKIKQLTVGKYTGTVYNFECDTHTFMCRNIITHNCDPYDHDESFTNSLGSTFIFKRVKAGEAWNDVIVAEYSGRPDTAEEYYENVRKLLMFYNARLLFENERKGIYPYFTNKHCDYLLADQPDKIISEVFKDSKVQRRKGCHMTKSIRAYGEGLILEWLMDEFEPGRPNLERIYSEPLLEELIENDGRKNVDRVIALCMTLIYREELYQVKVAESKEKNKQVELFEMPLFSQQWWDSDDKQDDIPVFTL